MDTKKQLDFIMAGGAVKRYHTVPGPHYQDNSQHQWGTAIILNIIEPNASKDLLLAALTHDTPEKITGDIPCPAKKRFPLLKEMAKDAEYFIIEEYDLDIALSDRERGILKLCDMIEAANFASQKFWSMNDEFIEVGQNCREIIIDLYMEGHIEGRHLEVANQLLTCPLKSTIEHYLVTPEHIDQCICAIEGRAYTDGDEIPF